MRTRSTSAPSLSSSTSLRALLRQKRRKAMFSSISSYFTSKLKSSEKYPVILNIYDSPRSSILNSHLYSLGLGRYFSTVVVHDWEYVFMEDTNGIRRSESNTFADEKQLTLRETIIIGYTDRDDEEVENEMSRLRMILKFGESKEYNGTTKNCNNFSDEFCSVLTGKGIPKWVNRIKFTTFIEGLLNPPPEPPQLEADITL